MYHVAVLWQFPLCLYLPQRSVWEEIWPAAFVSLECREAVGLNPASGLARRPELPPKTLKTCPPECKPAKKVPESASVPRPGPT